MLLSRLDTILGGNTDMIYITIGVLAFLLFIIYDINSIIMKNKYLNSCFFLGFLLLAAATIGIVITSWDLIIIDLLRMGIYGTLAAIFLFLLIYTLFFALPFKNTYVETKSNPEVCQNGIYALCRHPGVLWFMGFYIFFGLALKVPLLISAAVIFSVLNLFYVIFQDQWTFMKIFGNYDTYKLDTPFIIPNLKSIKRCLQTL